MSNNYVVDQLAYFTAHGVGLYLKPIRQYTRASKGCRLSSLLAETGMIKKVCACYAGGLLGQRACRHAERAHRYCRLATGNRTRSLSPAARNTAWEITPLASLKVTSTSKLIETIKLHMYIATRVLCPQTHEHIFASCTLTSRLHRMDLQSHVTKGTRERCASALNQPGKMATNSLRACPKRG